MSTIANHQPQRRQGQRAGEREDPDHRQAPVAQWPREHVGDRRGLRLHEQTGRERLGGDEDGAAGEHRSRALGQPGERGEIERQRGGRGRQHDVREGYPRAQAGGERALGRRQRQRCDEHAPAAKPPGQ